MALTTVINDEYVVLVAGVPNEYQVDARGVYAAQIIGRELDSGETINVTVSVRCSVAGGVLGWDPTFTATLDPATGPTVLTLPPVPVEVGWMVSMEQPTGSDSAITLIVWNLT